MESVEALRWIDTLRYPLGAPDSADLGSVIDRVRQLLREKGCAVLPGFVRRQALAEMAAEVAALAPRAHFTQAEATAYGGPPDESFPDGHPRRRILRRENGFVAGDHIGQGTELRRIYHSPALKRFLARCLEVEEVFEFADPLAQLVINVVKPGATHAWHFDSNEFVVSIMTQRAEAGGAFEYAPNIRGPGAENYDAVQALIDGRSTGQAIDLTPGDLQIFFGRYSLHRVHPTGGGRDRHTAILSYAKQPGMLGRSAKTATIYGRALASHDADGNRRVNDDLLTD